jgi:hypothetical protein
MSKFIRPAHLEFPKVYHTFLARDKDSDELVEYRVQDLPEEYFEKSMELLFSDFIPDETFALATDTLKKPEMFPDFRKLWHGIYHQRLSLGCFKNGSDELIGVNNLIVSGRNDNEEHNVSWD